MEKDKQINKSDIIERVYLEARNQDIQKSHVEKSINLFLQELNKALAKGEDISLVGHFSMYVVDQEAKTKKSFGKIIEVPAKKVPKCKFSETLKKQINNGEE